MAKRTLLGYRFSDGYVVYFMKGDPAHHILIRPGDTCILSQIFYDKIEFKHLKIKHSTWLKRLKLDTLHNAMLHNVTLQNVT